MNLSVSQKWLHSTGYLLLTLPTILFFLLTLKIWIGTICSIGLLIALYFAIHGYNNDTFFSIPLKNLIIVAILVMAWCILCGQGGIMAQKPDHHWRNAIMRDMVNYDWPVIYENGTGLVYYIGYWVVPALIGKIGLFWNANAAWSIANIALLCWSTLNITVVTLLILSAFNRSDTISCLLVCGMLALFSGMDIIGYVIYGLTSGKFCFPWNIEWWLNWSGSITLAYTSNSHLLGWVFNQAVPAWLGAILYYRERRIETAAFIGALLLPLSPFSLLGLIILASLDCICGIIINIKHENMIVVLRHIFSIPNVLSIIILLPIFYLYYSNNQTIERSDVANAQAATSFLFSVLNIRNWSQFGHYIVFCLLEFGILWVLMLKNNYKDRLYYICLASLLFFGATKIISMDYIIRSSIIPLFFLMLFAIKYVLTDCAVSWKDFSFKYLKKQLRFYLVILCLSIGSVTAFCEMLDTAYITQDCIRHGYQLPADKLGSLALTPPNTNRNFLVLSAESSAFYKYLARKPNNNAERIHFVNSQFKEFTSDDVYNYKSN